MQFSILRLEGTLSTYYLQKLIGACPLTRFFNVIASFQLVLFVPFLGRRDRRATQWPSRFPLTC
jgi:hypothetical protein